MYDNICRFLAENYSADFASWLLGETVTMTELKPSELFLDPIRADVYQLVRRDIMQQCCNLSLNPER
jgi:predicted transposase YdaD